MNSVKYIFQFYVYTPDCILMCAFFFCVFALLELWLGWMIQALTFPPVLLQHQFMLARVQIWVDVWNLEVKVTDKNIEYIEAQFI